MPTPPASDDSHLPKLRRFRFDSADPKVAREVVADSTDSPASDELALPVAPSEPERPSASAPSSHGDRADDPLTDDDQLTDDDLLIDPDRLLDETGSTAAPRRVPGAATSPTSGAIPVSSQSAPRLRGPVTGTSDRGPAAHAQADFAPPPTRATGGQTTTVERPRSRTGLIVAAVAAVAVLAVVAWLVFKPAGNDDSKVADSHSASRDESSAMTPEAWAGAVCTSLTQFQTSAMPLRAEAADAASGTSNTERLTSLRRDSSAALTKLADGLEGISAPAGNDALGALHEMLLKTSTEAASVAGGAKGGVGSSNDQASSIASALDSPIKAFSEAAEGLDERNHSVLAQTPQCQALL